MKPDWLKSLRLLKDHVAAIRKESAEFKRRISATGRTPVEVIYLMGVCERQFSDIEMTIEMIERQIELSGSVDNEPTD
jgi:hypothetical protein